MFENSEITRGGLPHRARIFKARYVPFIESNTHDFRASQGFSESVRYSVFKERETSSAFS